MPRVDIFNLALEAHGICSSANADAATIVNLRDLVLPTGFTTVLHECKEQGREDDPDLEVASCFTDIADRKDDPGLEDASGFTHVADIKMSMYYLYDLVERRRCLPGQRFNADAEHNGKMLEVKARMNELRDRVRAHNKALNEHYDDHEVMQHFISCCDDFMNELATSNSSIVNTLACLDFSPDPGMHSAVCELKLVELRYLESVERWLARMKFRRELEEEYATMSTSFDELDRDLSNMVDKLEQTLSSKLYSKRRFRGPPSRTRSSV